MAQLVPKLVPRQTEKQTQSTPAGEAVFKAILSEDIDWKPTEGKLPFPDGAIIARLAWTYVPSEENNKVFGREQSFVVGSPTNVQFMGQGLEKVCLHWWLGIRPIQRWQT